DGLREFGGQSGLLTVPRLLQTLVEFLLKPAQVPLQILDRRMLGGVILPRIPQLYSNGLDLLPQTRNRRIFERKGKGVDGRARCRRSAALSRASSLARSNSC